MASVALLPESAAAAELQVSLLRSAQDLAAWESPWREMLADRPLGATIFNDPAVVADAAAVAGRNLCVVLLHRGQRVEAAAPLLIEQTRLPLQLSVFQLAAAATTLATLCGHDVVRRADVPPALCYNLIFQALAEESLGLIALRAVDRDGPLWEFLAASRSAVASWTYLRPQQRIDVAYRLTLPAKFADYLATLGSSTRSSLKRRAKKLEAEQGARLVRVTEPEQVADFLEAVEEVYRDSWQCKTYGSASRNDPQEVRRLSRIADRGWLECYLLAGQGGPLAFQIGYRYADVFHACDFAFAAKYGELGPGAALMAMMLEELSRESPPPLVDLQPGDSPQKKTFRAEPRDVGDWFASCSPRWTRRIRLQQRLDAFESTSRRALERLKLDAAVRRFLKHK